MANIVKGIFALPLVAVIVGVALFDGSAVLLALTLLAALVVVAVPFLLKLAALAFVIFGTLWLLGAVVSAAGTSINNK